MNFTLLSFAVPWIALGLAVLALLGLWQAHRQAARRALYAAGQQADAEQRLAQLGETVRQLERRLERCQWELERLGEAPAAAPAPAASSVSAGDGNYQHAIKLARRGESVETLVEVCDLSRGEAELLIKLHRAVGKPA